MSRTSVLVIAGVALGSMFSFGAWAFPVASPDSQSARNILLVADGCGRGEHREHGRCEPDRPRVLERREEHREMERREHRICPPGMHFSVERDRCVL